MVWPAIIAAAATIAAQRSASRANKLAQQNANDQSQQSEELQREFAQHGIRWKVEDAKAAGLHPLYALGGSGASFTPSAQTIMPDTSQASMISSMGQNLSRAAESALQSEDERAIKNAQLEALRAAAFKDFALGQAAASESARRAQALQLTTDGTAASFPVPNDRYDPPLQTWVDGQPVNPDVRSLPPITYPPKPPPYLTDNVQPGFQRFNVPGLGEVILPAASSMAEAVESMENPVIQAAILAANTAHYGPEGGKKLERYLKKNKLWRLWSNPLNLPAHGGTPNMQQNNAFEPN